MAFFLGTICPKTGSFNLYLGALSYHVISPRRQSGTTDHLECIFTAHNLGRKKKVPMPAITTGFPMTWEQWVQVAEQLEARAALAERHGLKPQPNAGVR